MKKVLLIQNQIPRYRIPVFNALAKRHSLTVIYSDGEIQDNIDFEAVKIGTKRVSKFTIHKKSIYNIARNFDVVIALFDFSWGALMSLALLPRNFKFILWGIGVSASYQVKYDSIKKWDKLNTFLIKRSNAVLFYSFYPIEKYLRLGVDKKKMFVADNTVAVDLAYVKGNLVRNKILFVGSLYKEKGINNLLDSYYKAYMQNKNIPILYIIGEGDEYNNICDWINEKNMDEKIFLKGPIYDEKILSTYFNSSLACISPNQAGLSVLKSMGYGVPFITMNDAITGGERFNIKHGINGLLMESLNDLTNIILEMADNPNKYLNMGRKAQRFYTSCRTVNHMVDGFDKAIMYVCGD